MHFAIRSQTLSISMMALVTMLLTACATTSQLHITNQALATDLEPLALKSSGIAFITPSSVTGQEEDKQALALAFTEVMKRTRPDLRIVSLPETLGAINRAGLAGDYKQMFEDYPLTGIFSRDTLQKVSRVTSARYLAQLKLGGFRQESKSRWGMLGLRIVETKSASLRLYLQIWDGENGLIAWEGGQELTSAHESLYEDPISFKTAVEQAAIELVAHLP